MSVNEGSIDRLLRIIVGLVLIAMTPLVSGILGTPSLGNLAWIGVVPLLTGLIGWCPAYSLIGVNTCKR